MNLTPLFQSFPIDALPASMLKAVTDVIDFTQAPPALIASSCIATASVATQDLVDIERREGLVGPVGLLIVTICESGERKTTVDKLFTRSLREFDRMNDRDYQSKRFGYDAELAVWKIKKRGAERELQRAVGKDEPTEILSQRLVEIVKQAPQVPVHSPLLLNDATPAAIKEALRRERSAIGIFTNEGASVFKGSALVDFALINSLWDGGTVNIDRAGAGRWSIQDCRLTGSFMGQPEIFDGFLQRRGDEGRGGGFFGRMLFAFPPSTQGGRTLKRSLGQENLAQFNRRVQELLQEAQRRRMAGNEARLRTKFDWRAQQRWDEIFNVVETSVGLLGYLSQFKDYAAKYADNLARLAAIFHCFEGYSGDISLDTLERAQAVASWYLESFKHMFSTPPAPITLQPFQDAERLRYWLGTQYLEKGITVTPKKRLAQYGPYRVRAVHRLNPALSVLENWQVICPQIVAPNAVVQLHPLFVGQLQAQKSIVHASSVAVCHGATAN